MTKVSPTGHPASLGAFLLKGFGASGLTIIRTGLLYPIKRTAAGGGPVAAGVVDEALDGAGRECWRLRSGMARALCGAGSNAHFTRVMLALLLRAFVRPTDDEPGAVRRGEGVSDRITGWLWEGRDIDHHRCALGWGAIPSVGPPQWQALKRAGKGARSWLDPGRRRRRQADVWLRPPGQRDADQRAGDDPLAVEHGDRGSFEPLVPGFERWWSGRRSTRGAAATSPGCRGADIERAASSTPTVVVFWERARLRRLQRRRPDFRAFPSLVAIRQPGPRGRQPPRQKPGGFTNYIEVLHKPAFVWPWKWNNRPSARTGAPCGGTRGWQLLPQSVVIEAVLTQAAAPPGARHVRSAAVTRVSPIRTRQDPGGSKSLDFFAVATTS